MTKKERNITVTLSRPVLNKLVDVITIAIKHGSISDENFCKKFIKLITKHMSDEEMKDAPEEEAAPLDEQAADGEAPAEDDEASAENEEAAE